MTEVCIDFSVGITPFGEVDHLVDLKRFCNKLNKHSIYHQFTVLDPILDLPEPNKEPAQGRNYSPQFDVNVLFSLLENHRQRRRVDIIIGVIDSEVYDELFSTLNAESNAMVVSLRSPTLPNILEKSRRQYHHYLGLEIAAQLLCGQLRRRGTFEVDPTACQPPWHIQRLNCLYDWYGISPANVTKILNPKLSNLALAFFKEACVPNAYVVDGVHLAQEMTKLRAADYFRILAPDPFVSMVVGALIGWFSALITPEASLALKFTFFGALAGAFLWRVYLTFRTRGQI